jgi:hypothetical protein
MAFENRRRTTYGSGTAYILDPAGITLPSTEAEFKTFVETYCTEENQLGFLKNGITFTVDTETLEDQPDLGEMSVALITKENGTAETAVFNVNGETISRVYCTARQDNGVTRIGGLSGVSQDPRLFIFVEATKQQGKQAVIIAYVVNMSGFTLVWKPDGVEPFSVTFKLTPLNATGELLDINYVGELPKLPITGDTTYSITYETNGGVWAANYTAPDSYKHGDGDDITLPTSSNITKQGATFGGWYESTDLAAAVTGIDVSEESGNRTFIAKWTT